MIDEKVVTRTQKQLAEIAADLNGYLGDPTRTADMFLGCAIGVLVATYGTKSACEHLLSLAATLDQFNPNSMGGTPEC